MRRVLFASLLLALGLALPLWWTRSPPLEVESARASRGALVLTVATNATVEPVADFEVRARLDGHVLSIVKAGTSVVAGDVLVRIDATPVAAEMEAARSQALEAEEALRAARTRLERAERSLAVDEKLFRGRAVSEDRVAELRADRDEARAQHGFLEREVPVRLAALELRLAELQAQRTGADVHAPFSGTVYRSDVDVGEVVRQGQRVLSLADLERLQIRAHIDQVDLGKVRPGNPLAVEANAYPGRRWTGRLSAIEPHVEMVRNRAVTLALGTLDPPVDGLLPGMNVDVEIDVERADDVLQVPSRAIFASGSGPYVYVVDGDIAREQPVRLGRSSFTSVEVLRGVAEGERVILGPAPGLRDRMRVAARDVDDSP